MLDWEAVLVYLRYFKYGDYQVSPNVVDQKLPD